jgi:hypothetical protein
MEAAVEVEGAGLAESGAAPALTFVCFDKRLAATALD